MPMPGGALTMTVVVAVLVAPALSVTAAVIVCVPLDSPLVVREAPLPRAPSMLELHLLPAARFPSSESVADPVKVTGRSGAAGVERRRRPAGGLAGRSGARREQQPATQKQKNERAATNETSIDPAQGGPPRRRHEPCVWCLPSRDTYRQRSRFA